MPYDVHVVRTESWLDSKANPIGKSEVDRLVADDPELTWSDSDYIDFSDENGNSRRYSAIVWHGDPCFFWLDSEIRCANPDKAQLIKLVGIGSRLDAIVVGDDEERYSLGKSWFGRPKLITSE